MNFEECSADFLLKKTYSLNKVKPRLAAFLFSVLGETQRVFGNAVRERCIGAAPERPALNPPPGTNAQCDLARSYKRKIPFDGVMRICERSMSEADCRVCLGPEDN